MKKIYSILAFMLVSISTFSQTVISQLSVNTNYATDLDIGQSFTATASGLLTDVSFDFRTDDTADPVDRTVTVKIHGSELGINSINPTLYEETFNISVPVVNVLYKFTLTTPPTVTAGEGYTIELETDGDIRYSYANTNPYADGDMYIGTGKQPTFDWVFSATIDDSSLSNELPTAVDFSIYPNPSSDYITISGISETLAYQIINELGQTVSNGTISNEESVDISSLTSGMYFLKLGNGSIEKFIKL